MERLATEEGVGAMTTAVWVYSRERETGRQGRKKMRERKNIFVFNFRLSYLINIYLTGYTCYTVLF